MKNDSNLFYLCSLIEYIGRIKHLRRGELVTILGEKNLRHIYNHADVLHSEQIARVADEFINIANIPDGEYDNVASCKYEVPDYWAIGNVYERLIEDVAEDEAREVIDVLLDVYTSWIDAAISNYNSDFFYQSRDYIAECYKVGEVLQ